MSRPFPGGQGHDDRADDRRSVRPLRSGRGRGGTRQLPGTGVRIDARALIRYIRALDKATAAGAAGFWLEREQGRLSVPETVLEDFRTLMPARPRYAPGARSGGARTARNWNVILPSDVLDSHYEGLSMAVPSAQTLQRLTLVTGPMPASGRRVRRRSPCGRSRQRARRPPLLCRARPRLRSRLP